MTSAHGTSTHGPGQPLAVGDLARATGLTVRTLHHYDRLGLLSPARDAAGRRRYGPAETRRLHQIIALRGFGLPLAELEQMIEQRKRMTATLTPEELAQLQKQREEQVGKLTPEQLAELHQQRQQLLPDDFPEVRAG
jgi:DNA-binding transcriptional MerR regulator